MQRSVPEVAEATEAMEWLEREPLGYGAEPVRSHWGGSRGRCEAAWGCFRSLLGKAEKMGSSPEGCVFYSLDTKGGRPYLHIIWVMFRSEACGARNITKLRLC